jgi:hypothetical protein
MHNWGEVVVEVNAWDLKEPAGHYSGSKYTMSLDYKHPLTTDTLTT